MKRLLFAAFALSLSSCATIVKSDRQSVTLTGVPEATTAKVNLPDGSFEVRGGSSTILVTRSKDDIPIEVTCNGVVQKGLLPTHYDVGWAGLGNLVFGGIPGWIIDGVNPKGYNPQTPFSIQSMCADKPAELSAQQR